MFNNEKIKKFASFLILFVMFFNSGVSLATNLKTNQEEYIYEDEKQEILLEYKGSEKNIVLPDNIKIIKKGAFKNTSIEKLILNENLIEIEEEAFFGNNLKGTLILPNSLQRVGSYAFADNNLLEIDVSKIEKSAKFSTASFANNNIEKIIGLNKLDVIEDRMFASNNIKSLDFSENLKLIKEEAFLNNSLTDINIKSKEVKIERDAFSSNGQFVKINSDNIISEKSLLYDYGYIVNPVNIIVRNFTTNEDGKSKQLGIDKNLSFDPYNPSNFFTLNQNSYYEPEYIPGYVLNDKYHKDDVVEFIPDKDNFVLNVYYKSTPEPRIEFDEKKVNEFLKIKQKGSNIEKDELLSFVTAYDYKDRDITKDILISPSEIKNAEAKEYTILYSVMDDQGKKSNKELKLPIAIDPLKIKIANTEWMLEDFVYEGNKVVSLSKKGIEKSKMLAGIAIPHMNPYTMEMIEIIDFGEIEDFYLSEYIKDGPLAFGNPKAIKKISNNSFGSYGSNRNIKFTGKIPYMPNLEYVGNYVFSESSSLDMNIKNFPKLKYAGKSSFKNSGLTGEVKHLKDIENIKYEAFYNTNLYGEIPEFNKLKVLNDNAFSKSNIEGKLEDLPEIITFDGGAFMDTNISIPTFPKMPNVETIGRSSFSYFNTKGSLPKMPNLIIIEDEAFKGCEIDGSLPEMPNLFSIGREAFRDSTLSGELPSMPKLLNIDRKAFYKSNISGKLPEMNELYSIDDSVFSYTNITGGLENLPSLRTIGSYAFAYSAYEEELPYMPNLDRILDSAFLNSKLSGNIKGIKNVESIGPEAFAYTNISGNLPDFLNLNTLNNNAFFATKIKKDKAITINPKAYIHQNAFQVMKNDTDVQILLTENYEKAPNIYPSKTHIVNPKEIKFIGKNTKKETIVERITIYALKKSGDRYSFKIPKIPNYVGGHEIEISENDLKDNVYTHIYKSNNEEIDEANKNLYDLSIIEKPNNRADFGVKLSLKNKALSNGIISINYNNKFLDNFSVDKIEGVKDISYTKNGVDIYLNANILENSEIIIPLYTGYPNAHVDLSDKEIGVELYSNNKLLNYDSTLVDAGKNTPVYFNPKITGDNIENIDGVMEKSVSILDEGSDYEFILEIKQEVNTLRRFVNYKIEYDEVKYLDKYGNIQVAELVSAPYSDRLWRHEDNKYIYQFSNSYEKPDPGTINLKFKNVSPDSEIVNINSRVNAQIDTDIEENKFIEIEKNNKVKFKLVEGGENLIDKKVTYSYKENDKKYIVDNAVNKNSEIVWTTKYNAKRNSDKIIIKDYNLDERLRYEYIDIRLRNMSIENSIIEFYDKNNSLIDTITGEMNKKIELSPEIKTKASYVKIIVNNIETNANAQLEIKMYTKIKDPDNVNFDIENTNNQNFFISDTKIQDIANNQTTLEQYATEGFYLSRNYAEFNTKLPYSVNKVEYRKDTESKIGLTSNKSVDISLDKLEMTILINPAHKVKDVKMYASGDYELKETKNGYTEVNITIIDEHFSFLFDEDVANIITTPKDKSETPLEIHALIHPSKTENYGLLNKGKGQLEGYELSNYSYNTKSYKVVNQKIFIAKKSIGNNKEIKETLNIHPKEEFFYRLEVDNNTDFIREDFKLIDILPFKNDKHGSYGRDYIDAEKINKLKLPDGVKMYFYNSNYEDLLNKNYEFDDLIDLEWSTTPTEDTKAILVEVDSVGSEDDALIIDIPMIADSDTKEESHKAKNINTFMYSYKDSKSSYALSNKVFKVYDQTTPQKRLEFKRVSTYRGEVEGFVDNALFALYDTNKNKIDIARSDINGDVFFKNIPIGNYIIKEIETPYGHTKSDERLITKEELEIGYYTVELEDFKAEIAHEYEFVLKNVELNDNLKDIKYRDVSELYSKDITGGQFEFRRLKDNSKKIIDVDKDRVGKIKLYTDEYYEIKQKKVAKDNGVIYEKNDITYKFYIDKYGYIEIADGFDGSIGDKISQNSQIIYFPNNKDLRASNLIVQSIDNKTGETLEGSEFVLRNTNNNETTIINTNEDGFSEPIELGEGIYELKQTKAPQGYSIDYKTRVIEVNSETEKELIEEFENFKITLNIHKHFKLDHLFISEESAKEAIEKIKGYNSGYFEIEKEGDFYTIKEVWEDKISYINDEKLLSNKNGSILNVENIIDVANGDKVITIKNLQDISGYNLKEQLDVNLLEYTMSEDFDGSIDIYVPISPLKGVLFVSKYIIDENKEFSVNNKEHIKGTEYTLYSKKTSSSPYQSITTKTMSEDNIMAFKDLNPNYKYKIVESFVPENQLESKIKEHEFELNQDNRYKSSIVFRNYIPLNKGRVTIKLSDGEDKKPLEGVEFAILYPSGETRYKKTNSKGELVFDELLFIDAPFTIVQTSANEGYRLNTKSIKVSEDDLRNEKVFKINNFKESNIPETGTLGKLPSITLSMILLSLAVVFKRKEDLI